ncbi:MAG: protein phosphatase 2C domain-containing protein [Gammaproteobacteria bacterium]|nr:protein phosphatase 2C domain-containing protein [Gammaproteobacteria bacterium]MDH5630742.1 protein phosphatase 2C domain-containing protein [Gammaproteobacteria bacterium]
MDKRQANKIESKHITDVGCVRELNEDAIMVTDNLWLLADGMGGHACGEVASQLAVETIVKEFGKKQNLVDAIQTAHQKVLKQGKKKKAQKGMGTTIVAAACENGSYDVAWVGDSRAYLWDGKKLVQLTEDHSLMMRLVNSGLLSMEEASRHPQRHIITQCLGSLELDRVLVDRISGNWQYGQQLLLCSDGLSDDVTNEEISAILKQELGNKDKLNLMVKIAKDKGGKDNISIVLIDSPVKIENKTPWMKQLISKLQGYFNK